MKLIENIFTLKFDHLQILNKTRLEICLILIKFQTNNFKIP